MSHLTRKRIENALERTVRYSDYVLYLYHIIRLTRMQLRYYVLLYVRV